MCLRWGKSCWEIWVSGWKRSERVRSWVAPADSGARSGIGLSELLQAQSEFQKVDVDAGKWVYSNILAIGCYSQLISFQHLIGSCRVSFLATETRFLGAQSLSRLQSYFMTMAKLFLVPPALSSTFLNCSFLSFENKSVALQR